RSSGDSLRRMGIATSASFSEAPGSEPRTLTALLLEWIALRHQIAVLERCRTRRPCFRLLDRLFWIVFSRWWPRWRDSLIIVQPETVLRWRRDGWSALWRYRARGRWRGGRPRISSEVRDLIAQMARQNFLWGAPRIHGELLMLGFSVSQATVSRYLPARSRRPGQSWRTFLRNQAAAFGHHEHAEERSRGDAGLQGQSHWAQLKRSAAAQIATAWVGLRRCLAQQQPTLSVGRISVRSAQCDRGVTHRAARVSGGSRRALCNRSGAAFLIRSPPQQAWGSRLPWPGADSRRALVPSRARISSPRSLPGRPPRTHRPETSRPRPAPAFPCARIRF